MALSAVGYTASGASITAANGNYIPLTGANATCGGVTQYSNGVDFLSYAGSNQWYISASVNAISSPLYAISTGSPTNVPLTGWNVVSGTAPAPTLVNNSPVVILRRRPPMSF